MTHNGLNHLNKVQICIILTFFNGFWPFNAKIRVASGEEYWGPLGKNIGAA